MYFFHLIFAFFSGVPIFFIRLFASLIVVPFSFITPVITPQFLFHSWYPICHIRWYYVEPFQNKENLYFTKFVEFCGMQSFCYCFASDGFKSISQKEINWPSISPCMEVTLIQPGMSLFDGWRLIGGFEILASYFKEKEHSLSIGK